MELHKIFVLTVDADRRGHEMSVVGHSSDGSSQTYHFVGQLDDLLHYRNETVPDEEARKHIGH